MGRGLCREAETVSGSDPAGVQGFLEVLPAALPRELPVALAFAFGAAFGFALAGVLALVDEFLPAAGC